MTLKRKKAVTATLNMELQKAKQAIEEVINGKRHSNYAHTVKLANLGHRLVDAEDLDDLLHQIRSRESEDLKKQRTRLTNHYTGLGLHQCMNYQARSRRLPGIKEVLEHKSPEELARMKKIASNWSDNYSMFDYTFKELLYHNYTDPNALFVCSFMREDPEDNDTIKSEPIIYPASQVLNLKQENRRSIWAVVEEKEFVVKEKKEEVNAQLVDRHKIPTGKTKDKKVYSTFILYAKGIQVKYRELDPDEEGELLGVKITVSSEGKDRMFDVTEHTPGNDNYNCFAFMGFQRDYLRGGACFLPIWHTAKPLIKDLIRDKSFLDISKALHTYPKQYVYVEKCDHETDEGECENGFIDGQLESICPACNGSGHKFHTSEQEVIRVKLPEGDNPLEPLSHYSHYQIVPIDIVEFLDKAVKEHIRMLPLVILGVALHDQTVQKTATEVNEMSYMANDSMYDFCNKVSAVVTQFLHCTAEYSLKDASKFVGYHSFPAEVMNRSISELYQLFETAGKASPVVQEGILEEIIIKQFANEPTKAMQITTFNKHKPFRHLDPTMLTFVLASRDNSDLERVKFENWSSITTAVWERYNEKLFEMKFLKQEEAINKEAQRFVVKEVVQPIRIGIGEEEE